MVKDPYMSLPLVMEDGTMTRVQLMDMLTAYIP